jgi:2-polyprenyl-3-methyl-5-hydroxy-6-metoxy-1,4-benzoquinol methylase
MHGFRTDRVSYILQQVRPGARILHIGCACSPNTIRGWTLGTLLHLKLYDEVKKQGAYLVGLDLDGASLDWLKEKMPDAELIHGDAHKLQESFGSSGHFDLIIAGDVIEHLPNPGLFLDSCRPLLLPGGRMLITTINTFGIARIAKTLFFHEAVHPEHTTYFSHQTLSRLCSMSGWEVQKRGYIKSEPLDGFSLNRFCSILLEKTASIVYPHFSEGIVVEVGLPQTNPT